jgi:hypothetical protein
MKIATVNETSALSLPTPRSSGRGDREALSPLDPAGHAGQAAAGPGDVFPLVSSGRGDDQVLSPLASAERAGQAAAGPGDVPVELVGAWAFGGDAAGRKMKARFMKSVAGRVTRDEVGRERLPPDVLVDRGPYAGRTIGELVQRERSTPVPDEVKHGTEREGQRWIGEQKIKNWIADLGREHPGLGRSTRAFTDEFARVYGPALDQLRSETGFKFRLGKRVLCRIANGKPSHWGRSGRRREELFDADIFQEAIALYIHPNKISPRGAYGIYAYCQAKAAQEGKLWRGKRTVFVERLKEAVPESYRKLGQEGEWKFERDAIPKFVRPRGRFACGEAASLDGRDVNDLARVPTSAGGWRPIRPVEVVFFDVESGYPLGWHIGDREDANATLLAFRHMHERVGLPSYIETDNGKGFCAAFGSRRRKFPEGDVRRLHALCEYVRVKVDHKFRKHAWEKSAESRFAARTEIDRLRGHFIGIRPDERPEDVLRRVKRDVMELPTLDEYRRERAADFELYADTPSPALGGLTRRQYFEQHRGAVRKVDPEFLAFASSRCIGERTVGRQGVTYKGILYGHGDEEIFKLWRRRVWLRLDPADLSMVWVCDQRGAPLCIATRSDLTGATPEHLKEAQRRRGHLRKIAREFVREHAFFQGTAVRQVRQVLAEHRAAEAAEYRRQHEPPAAGPVQVVGSEHVPAVRKARAAARREETRRVLQSGTGRGSEAPSDPVQTGLDLLRAAAHAVPEPEEETECVADRLRRFNHAG